MSALLAVDASGALHTLATDPLDVSLLGANGGSVVWTTGIDVHVYTAASAATGSPTDLGVSLANYQGSYDTPLLAVVSGYLLWSDGRTGLGAYWSLPLTGGTPAAHTLTGAASSAIAADGIILWITNQGVAVVGAVPDAAGATPIPEPAGARWTPPIGLRAGTAYFDDSGFAGGTYVGAVDVKTGAARHIDSAITMPSATCAQPGIWGVATLLVGLDETLYGGEFTDCAADGKEHLDVIRVHANALTVVADFTSSYQAIPPLAVDAACLYWIESDGTSARLMTVAR
jgi:hypothetical protein